MNVKHILENTIWYDKSAESWIEALPVGNGRLGAMVYGRANFEKLALNEETLWAGKEIDRHNPDALSALPKVRSLLFEGKNAEAAVLAEKTMVSTPPELFAYQPLGNLMIQNMRSRRYDGYRRGLDLSVAEASSSWRCNGANHIRRCFVSAPGDVLVYHLETDAPEGIQAMVFLERERGAVVELRDNSTLILRGSCAEGGVRFCAMARAVDGEGQPVYGFSLNDWHMLALVGQKSVNVFFAAYSNYNTEDPEAACEKTLGRAIQDGYEQVRETHRQDYCALYDRFSLTLNPDNDFEPSLSELDTAGRIERTGSGAEDLSFFTLYLNYNRYLLLSASRPGGLPANLQGIWNESYTPPWQSDFHSNVNLQINYWCAEAFGLPECHEPLFDWLSRVVAKTGAETARRQYGASGWVLHHCTDLWGSASPIYSLLGIWPMGGAWLCRHLYEHYLYTLDEAFLREQALPLMTAASQFFLDYLVEAPGNTACPGKLVTNPSHSPENRFVAPDGSESWFSYGCTMDIHIIRELFANTAAALKLFGKDEANDSLREALSAAIEKLPRTKVSPRSGGIQEWIEDYEEVEPGHRHISHLYANYPGSAINKEETPELCGAVLKTLDNRLAAGYDGQGWSIGWLACQFARLGLGERAYEQLTNILRQHLHYNLFINSHGLPQVADAQAFPAAMLEMLAQSHNGVIRLLPALPREWPNGEIRGMRLRGGCLLDMQWRGGLLQKACVTMAAAAALPTMEALDENVFSVTESGNQIVVVRK
jgi:alpha-L-fucosidase 2